MELKNKLREISLVKEEAVDNQPKITTEKEGESKPAPHKSASYDKEGSYNRGLSQRVLSLLSNDIFNHAAVTKHVFGKKGGTERSLFRKKLENIEGHHFTDEELSKIVNFMKDTSKNIDKHLSSKKQK